LINQFGWDGGSIASISADRENFHFSIQRGLLVSRTDGTAVRRSGWGREVLPQNVIRRLGNSRFANTRLKALAFQEESALKIVDESCFGRCFIGLFCISGSVQILGRSGFWKSAVEILRFESESELKQIDELCLSHCSRMSICIPRSATILWKSRLNQARNGQDLWKVVLKNVS
jgi:hypothetical protein